MESILSIQEEIYPLKSRRQKSLSYLSNSNSLRLNALNSRIYTLSLFYQYIKKMIAQRSIYILGLINLILAGVAIICVIQAEDDPEYFSLVYVTVCIFIFYMATIVFIILLQVIQTYQHQNKKNPSSAFSSSSSSIQAPLLTPKIINQPNQILVETTITNAQPKTSLSRSQTLPLASFPLNSHYSLSSTILPSVTCDEKHLKSIQTTHLELIPKYHQSASNIPKNCQSFTLITTDQLRSSHKSLRNSDKFPLTSSIAKPIPLRCHGSMKINRPKIKFSDA